jgi:demethylmenaquinone methyltransferase/2-methoxy-6-polyprenyl-1,4-benzoquinol methylase
MSTKPAHVREMFGSIAARYDLVNHVLSCGLDFYWRARAQRSSTPGTHIRWLILQPGRAI